MIKVSWMRKKFWSIYYDCTVAATTLFITHKTQKQYSAILKNYCTLSARGSLLKKIFFIFTLVVSASIVWRSVIFPPPTYYWMISPISINCQNERVTFGSGGSVRMEKTSSEEKDLSEICQNGSWKCCFHPNIFSQYLILSMCYVFYMELNWFSQNFPCCKSCLTQTLTGSFSCTLCI